MCYDRLLFSIYNKESSPPIRIANHTELKVLEKGRKPTVIYFCNILYAPEVKYNLPLVGTIEKAGYLILTKKRKIKVFNDKDNIAFEAIKIETSYLVNILDDKEILALASLHLVSHNNTS